ncbi:hypothetical protein [Abyssalbus ytuae]|uniref:Addiction module component n=1 Tax=Abyssalbus ytuae TaxID=2926907 RepID=A0A9E6ZXE2_9FLAO|nr:hypothetical protein [Abyssalbus ytuae]UOB16912.1 hypothetical protein MQE35_14370 [Abyssalbus ytuae]
MKRISDFVERSSLKDQYDISEEHKQLLDRSLANHNEDPASGKEWSELKSELSAKYGL